MSDLNTIKNSINDVLSSSGNNADVYKNNAFFNASIASGLSNTTTTLDAHKLLEINNTVSTITGGKSLNIGAAQSILDCALSLEDRILAKLQQEAIDKILSTKSAKEVIGAVTIASQYVTAANDLINFVKDSKPEDLIAAILKAKALQGVSQIQKINEIISKFGGYVDNINELLSNIASLDICKIPNYGSNGTYKPGPIPAPLSPPTGVSPISSPVTVNTAAVQTKNEYDDLMFRIKGYTSKQNNLNSSVDTAVNIVVMSYHDKIYKSTSNESDVKFYQEYLNSIDIEKSKHISSWTTDEQNLYNERCTGAGGLIKNKADVIRAYGMRYNTSIISGSLLSVGITTYSPPDVDFTTFLDLKPSQRTPELTAYWESRGRNIASQEAKLNNRGIKTGTLNLSDTTSGAYGGTLESDFSCASTRVPGGSVLALKNPDGTPYNPTGKNPQGVYTVADTGNAALTYHKVDVFTRSPDLYKNTANVHVYLVSSGSKTNSQYRLAQSKYGSSKVV